MRHPSAGGWCPKGHPWGDTARRVAPPHTFVVASNGSDSAGEVSATESLLVCGLRSKKSEGLQRSFRPGIKFGMQELVQKSQLKTIKLKSPTSLQSN